MARVSIEPIRPATSEERSALVQQAITLARDICSAGSETFEVSSPAVTMLLDERARLAHTLLLFLEKGLEAERRVADLTAAVDVREARIHQLLRDFVRLTQEQPFPEELREWPAQRAALIAEVGTLRARLAELEARRD